jgi:hypothetical protein
MISSILKILLSVAIAVPLFVGFQERCCSSRSLDSALQRARTSKRWPSSPDGVKLRG